MKFHELGLVLPDFVELPSGLLVPVEVQGQVAPPALPRGLKRPRPAPSVVVSRLPPAPIDNIRAWIDEPQLNLEPTSFQRLLEYLRVLPFETACHAVSWLLRRLHPIQVDVQAQLELVDLVYAQLPDVPARVREAAIGERGHLPFAEPLLLALMRLLVARSPDAVPNGLENDMEVVFERALLGLPSALDNWSLQGHGASDLPSWLGFFMQKGNFIRQRASLNELVRPHLLFELMGGPLDERAAKERCEVNAALKERYGFTHEEQFRLGMGLAAILHLFDDEPGNACRVAPGEFPRLLESVKLEDRHDAALDLISGDREHFQGEFDRLDQDGSLLRSMRLPFQQRPFIRFRDGSLVLLSPSLLHEWLTDGFHYRALDAVAGIPPAKSRSARPPNASR